MIKYDFNNEPFLIQPKSFERYNNILNRFTKNWEDLTSSKHRLI